MPKKVEDKTVKRFCDESILFNKDIIEAWGIPSTYEKGCTNLVSILETEKYCEKIPLLTKITSRNVIYDYKYANVNKFLNTKVPKLPSLVSKKFRINPTKKQKEILKDWFGSCRWTRNKVLELINKEIQESLDSERRPKEINKEECRKVFVSKTLKTEVKNYDKFIQLPTENVKTHENRFKTPKAVRENALFQICTNYNTQVSEKKIKRCWRYHKKKNLKDVIGLPHNSLKSVGTDENKGLLDIYPNTLGKIKLACSNRDTRKFEEIWNNEKHDFKISFDGVYYFIILPHKPKTFQGVKSKDLASIDPGVRSFISIFDGEHAIDFKTDERTIDHMKEDTERTKEKARRKLIPKYIARLREIKERERVKSMHIEVARLVASRHHNVIIGKLDSQKCVDGSKNKTLNRRLNFLAHYKFRQRLELECSKYGTGFAVQNEAYTTKGCTKCGKITDIGASKKFECLHCLHGEDRDINAARNIALKHMEMH